MSETASPHLSLELRHRLGTLNLDLAFALTQPWTVLFGPSGSGKSSILRAIAGLLRPTHAKISLHWRGQLQVVTDTSNRIFIPPHRRFARWSAQAPAPFPNMSVLENLRLALPPATDLDKAVTLFRLDPILTRRPANLSGGEQQRVAIARAAIASEGRLLLLDEPFSGLDAPLRDDLITGLQAWLALTTTPVLLVTHDIAEAFQLNAEVIKLHDGRVIAQGPPAEVLANERKRLLYQLNELPLS